MSQPTHFTLNIPAVIKAFVSNADAVGNILTAETKAQNEFWFDINQAVIAVEQTQSITCDIHKIFSKWMIGKWIPDGTVASCLFIDAIIANKK